MGIPPLGTEDDPLKLLHELQVHQIELEMQNDELRRFSEDEAKALEKYTDLYDFAPVGYCTLDRSGTISEANLTSSALIGIDRSTLIGRRLGFFFSDKTRSAFADFLEKVFTSSAQEECEVELLKDGTSELFVHITGVAAASGNECRVVMVDITERKQAVEAVRLANEATEVLRQAYKEAEALFFGDEAIEALRMANMRAEALIKEKGAAEALYLARETAAKIRMAKQAATELRLAKESAEATARTKSQFFANMSHELRTPMTGILGMLQLALEEDLAPAPKEYLETSLRSARSLLQILNDILDMSKIEAGKFTIEEKPFSLEECLTEAVDIISPEVRRKGLDLAISVTDEIPKSVVGDQTRLRQIFLNLIGNAVKFTENGKVEMQVTAGKMSSDAKREFDFTIKDTGIGIPDDKKQLLFQKFSQVDASHSRIYGGTGLGLAICREIVELMGGTIRFESEEGMGSSFSFTIPLREAVPESNALVSTNGHSLETAIIPEGSRMPHLLLVEDDPTIRQMLELMLTKSNYNLDIAENGQMAVEMWEKGEYDLVLMDVQMPHLNGFDATRTIREKERTRGGYTSIVAMTAHASKEDEKNCLDSGMDAFIPKPIDFMECLKLIGQIIKQKSGDGV